MDNRYFYDRRTYRAFGDKEVSDALLEGLLDAASHAPTTGNMQLYSVVITREAEARKELAKTHFNQPASLNAPVLLTFCADFNRFTSWCRQSDADAGYDNLQGFTTAMLDAVIFAQQFNTVAEMNGLGCCYLGTTTYNAPDIARLLELPSLVVPVVTLAVGYPEGKVDDCGRLPVKGLIHHEKYHAVTPDDIKTIYAEKENREDSKRFVEENGKANLAQVFTDVRYTRGMMESFSATWREFIKAQGFKL